MRKEIAALRENSDDPQAADGYELAATEEPERAERLGVPLTDLKRFAKVALDSGLLLSDASEMYIDARSPNNRYGYAPLSVFTIAGFRTAVGYLREYLKDAEGTATLQDVTPAKARAFKLDFLHNLQTVRTPKGLSAKSIEKQITMLSPFWVWATEQNLIPSDQKDRWVFGKGVRRAVAADTPARDHDTHPTRSSCSPLAFCGATVAAI